MTTSRGNTTAGSPGSFSALPLIQPQGWGVRNPLARLNPRPRLMADAAAIQRVEDAIGKDATSTGKNLRKQVIKRATKLLTSSDPSDVPVSWQPGDLYEASKLALKHMQYLGLAWRLDGGDAYVQRAKLELKAICDFPDWNPPHFLDTAGLTLAVAIGYDWFYDKLDAGERAQCVAALLKNGLAPGLTHLTGAAGKRWPRMISNWNIICNAGLMTGALAVGEEKSGLTDEVFRRCLDSVSIGLRGYSPEGAWAEGPQYWSRATTYAAYLLSSLKTAVGHEFGLGDLPGLRNTGFFRLHAEGSAVTQDADRVRMLFNFYDCEEARGGSWCMRWLSWRYGRSEFNWAALNDDEQTPMDLLWFSPDRSSNSDSIPRNASFRGIAEVAMMRGKSSRGDAGFRPWNQEGGHAVFLGIRAGTNTLQSDHVHLDLGSFVLDTGQLRWAIDIPPVANVEPPYLADYKLPDYFTLALDKRYRYYRTGTSSHNTLVVNGRNQPLGIDTEIVAFGEAEQPSLVLAVVDMTDAFPDCLRVLRGFALIDGEHVLIVDEVTPMGKISLAWQMHTGATAREGPQAVLNQTDGSNGRSQEFFVRLLEPSGAEFKVEKAPETPAPEMPSKGICKLLATFPNVVEPTRIAVLLSADGGMIKIPKLLEGPLWTWIVWANDPKQRHQAFPYSPAD